MDRGGDGLRYSTDYNTIELSIGNSLFTIFCDNIFIGGGNSSHHVHFFHEFHYVISGNESIKTNSEEFYVDKNYLCILPIGMYHSVKSDEDSSKIYFLFDMTRKNDIDIDTYAVFENLFKKNEPIIIENKSPYFDELIKNYGKKNTLDTMTAIKLKHILTLIFIDIYEKHQFKKPEIASNTITYSNELRMKTEEFIQNSFPSELKLEILANHLCLSPKQADRIVRKYMGSSFQSIATKIKMDKAMDLIRTTTISLEKIAFEVGYTTYAGFSRSFKEYTGISPNQYRQDTKKTPS